MRSSLLLLSLLLPSLAAAQTPTPLTLEFGPNQNVNANRRTLTAGVAACADPIVVRWTALQNSCEPLIVYLVDSKTACTNIAPASGALRKSVSVNDVNTAQPASGGVAGSHAGTVSFTMDEVFAAVPAVGDVSTTCGRADVQEERRFHVCAATKGFGGITGNSCEVNIGSTPDDLTAFYDHKKPDKPVPTVSAGEKKLVVTLPNPGADIQFFAVKYRKDGETEFKGPISVDALKPVEIKGLENNATYFVVATQTDFGDNESDPSDEVQGIPVETVDFWEYYQDAGGTDGGGCGVAGGAGLSLGAALAVVGLWLASRRRAS